MIWIKLIFKWVGIGLGSILFLYILTHPWLRMDRIEFYIAYKTWAENVKSHKFIRQGEQQNYPGMRITIIGSNLEDLAFSRSRDLEKMWREQMKELAENIIAKLEKRNQLDILELEIVVQGSQGRLGLKNFSPRRMIFFYSVPKKNKELDKNSNIFIVMGVSGCGKTTIGKKLAQELGLPFYDADDFHPEANVLKMQSNIPLTDEDRLPWLKTLATNIDIWKKEKDGGAVLACSALKKSYRQIISADNNYQWIFLDGDFELIKERMENRKNHFMKPDLLQSQFDALETPYDAIHIPIDQTPDSIIEVILMNIK